MNPPSSRRIMRPWPQKFTIPLHSHTAMCPPGGPDPEPSVVWSYQTSPRSISRDAAPALRLPYGWVPIPTHTDHLRVLSYVTGTYLRLKTYRHVEGRPLGTAPSRSTTVNTGAVPQDTIIPPSRRVYTSPSRTSLAPYRAGPASF